MYNQLYKQLEGNNLLFEKQFHFKLNNSAEFVIVQIVDGIYVSSEKWEYTHTQEWYFLICS